MRVHAYQYCLWLMLSLFFMPMALANATPTAKVLALSSFLPGQEKDIRLTGMSDEVILHVPISKRTNVKVMKLHLEFSNSMALSKDRSQLLFRINGHLLGQARLNPAYPEGTLNIKIPNHFLKYGDNLVSIESSLTPFDGGYSSGSELWAEINIRDSNLSLFSERRKINPSFSSLEDLVVGSKWSEHYPLAVVFVDKEPSDELLNAASAAVQGLALLTHGLPVHVETLRAELTELKRLEVFESAKTVEAPATEIVGASEGKETPEVEGTAEAVVSAEAEETPMQALQRLQLGAHPKDTILLANYADLKRMFGDQFVPSTDVDEQAFLHLNPHDSSSFLLIITGKSEADVLSSAKHFASMNLSLAQGDSVQFAAEKKTLSFVDKHRNTIKPMMRYTFKELGLERTALTGMGGKVELLLKMPADLFATRDDAVDLTMHLSYAAGLALGSKLDVFLNGDFQHSILTDDPHGMLINQYKIKLPLRAFHKGMNRVRFEVHLLPGEAARHNAELRKSLKVTLYEDSLVRVPNLDRYVRLPDLRIFSATAYPYVEAAPSRLFVSGKTPAYYAAALSLVSKFAQIQRRLVPEVSITAKAPSYPREDVFFIGTLRDTPALVFHASPFDEAGDGLTFPVQGSDAARGVEYNTLSTMVGFDEIVDAFMRESKVSTGRQYLNMTQYGSLSQFESPWGSSKSLTLLMVKDQDSLLEAVYRLLDDDVWSSMKGDAMFWRISGKHDEHTTFSMLLSDEYHAGTLSLKGQLAYYAITSPLYLMAMVISLALLLTWLTRRMMMAYHAVRDE